MSLNTIHFKPAYGRRGRNNRIHNHVKSAAFFMMFALVYIFPAPSFAYVGPGPGITALGALWALIATVVITLVGLLIWPIRALMKRKKQSGVPVEESESGEIAKTDSE
ncbi:MAG: hypothetical protein IIA62_11125 [Nitrospinae bacterium]|nr:hypothetical protein [Nitrospinota bacterium]